MKFRIQPRRTPHQNICIHRKDSLECISSYSCSIRNWERFCLFKALRCLAYSTPRIGAGGKRRQRLHYNWVGYPTSNRLGGIMSNGIIRSQTRSHGGIGHCYASSHWGSTSDSVVASGSGLGALPCVFAR